jgi:carboxylesterase type B
MCEQHNHLENHSYAAPPVDNLRWRAPVLIEQYLDGKNSTIVTEATNQGSACIQASPGWQTIKATNSTTVLAHK